MKTQIRQQILSARKKRAINNTAADFAKKALEHHNPAGSKNLSEFYCGCIHGLAAVCNILNLNSEEIDSLLKELHKI